MGDEPSFDPGVYSGQALLENLAFLLVVLALGAATVLGGLLWSVLRWWTRRRTDAAARRRLRAMGRGFRE